MIHLVHLLWPVVVVAVYLAIRCSIRIEYLTKNPPPCRHRARVWEDSDTLWVIAWSGRVELSCVECHHFDRDWPRTWRIPIAEPMYFD